MLKKIILIAVFGLWPLNLYLNNTPGDFLNYTVPLVLTGISYVLHLKKSDYYYLPLLLIGLFSPKLTLIPVIYFCIEILRLRSLKLLLPLFISLAIFVAFFKPFFGQTIFTKDYEAQQLVIRNIHLYPNPLLARVFQNKGKIYYDKAVGNFFTLTDPNNYFFALHPRPISVDNQNLYKYPFVSLVFFFIGVYYLKNFRQKNFTLTLFTSSIICLMILKNFDRNDFILYLPISLIIYHGINTLEVLNNKLYKMFAYVLIIFSIPEFLRSYVENLF